MDMASMMGGMGDGGGGMPGGMDLASMMGGMGGGAGGGMPGGMDFVSFCTPCKDEADNRQSKMMEQMGGAGGMPDFGGDDDDEGDDADVEGEAAADKGKGKAEVS